MIDGLLNGLGLTTRNRRLGAWLGALTLGAAMLIAPDRTPDPRRAIEASQASAREVVEQSAAAQCIESIVFVNHRAKMGFNNVKHTPAGDVLIEQPFSVPVFGYNERDEYRARCALRKNGSFEFEVVR